MQSRKRELEAAIAEQREPRFHYPALEVEKVRRHITGLLQLDEEIRQHESNVIVRRLYQGAIEDEIAYLHLVEATYKGSNEHFRQLNHRRYGEPTVEEMRDALASLRRVLLQGLLQPKTSPISQQIIQILHERFHIILDLSYSEEEYESIQHSVPIATPQTQQMISSQAAKEFFETVLHESGFDSWQVIIDPKVNGTRVEPGLRQLFLQQESISPERVKHLLAHELAGHVARAVAGERSPLGLLAINTKGYLPTEEGLALYQEHQITASQGAIFNESGAWSSTLATGLASGVISAPQTFFSLFTFFEPFHLLFRLLRRLDKDMQTAQAKARQAALSRCLRTYRGVPDLEQPGTCLCQDVVYLRGLRMIQRAVAEDETVLDRLGVGKIALELFTDIEELGIVAPPQPLRKLASDPDLDRYILSFEQPNAHPVS